MRNPKKVLTILAIVLVGYWVLSSPVSASNAVQNGVGKLGDGADSVQVFATNLFSG